MARCLDVWGAPKVNKRQRKKAYYKFIRGTLTEVQHRRIRHRFRQIAKTQLFMTPPKILLPELPPRDDFHDALSYAAAHKVHQYRPASSLVMFPMNKRQRKKAWRAHKRRQMDAVRRVILRGEVFIGGHRFDLATILDPEIRLSHCSIIAPQKKGS